MYLGLKTATEPRFKTKGFWRAPALLSFLFLSFFLSACTKTGEKGSKSNPLTMMFVPADDTQTILNSATEIASYMEKYISQKIYQKDQGFYIKASVPSSFIAVIEAFGTSRADFACLNTFGYYLLKDVKNYPGEAILNVVRGENETTYRGQFVARAGSGINKIEDIEGKKIAYSDPTSTSGYILPSALLAAKGIKPKEVVFAMKHDNVITMVYQGQVDVGATYYNPPQIKMVDGKKVEVLGDARHRVVTQFPDVAQKVKIIGFTDEIPNAPWVLRSNLFPQDPKKYESLKTYIQDGLIEFAKTEHGKKILMDLYSISGIVKATDQDFASTLKMMRDSNVDAEAALKKK